MEADDKLLIRELESSRAASMMKSFDADVWSTLGWVGCGSGRCCGVSVEKLNQLGIWGSYTNCWERQLTSSLLWWRLVQLRVGDLVRSTTHPTTLTDRVSTVLESMEYAGVQTRAQQRVDSVLDGVWEIEFHYKVCITPGSFAVSIEYGPFPGFLRLTRAGDGVVWAIAMLRNGSDLQKHVEQFLEAGVYASLGVSDYALVDFHSVKSIDQVDLEAVARDLQSCDKLRIVYSIYTAPTVKIYEPLGSSFDVRSFQFDVDSDRSP